MTRALAVVTVAALVGLASPVAAAGPPKTAAPPHMQVYPLAVPILHQGRVVNYVFVTLSLSAPAGTDMNPLKAKEPMLRDAIVRAAHRQSYAAAGSLTRVDERRLGAVVLAEARRLTGAASFTKVEVARQVPQRVSGLPVLATERPAVTR